MNRLSPILGALLLGWLAAAGSAGEWELLQFAKPIQRPPAHEEEILAIPLDAEVYAATQPNLADLRVLDAARAEVPLQIEQATDTTVDTVRRPTRGTVRSLVTNETDNRIEVLVELEQPDPAADGVTLITPLRNFERRVSVYGSDDAVSWQPLAVDAMIFDYSRFMDLSQRDIPLPPNAFRRLKLIIQDVVDDHASPLQELSRQFEQSTETGRTERSLIERRPLRLDRLELWRNVLQPRVERAVCADYPIAGFQVAEDARTKSTVVYVHTRREPLVQFTLETSSANFSRSAVVEARSTQGVTVTWTSVGRATLSRFRFRDWHREQLAIAFAEQRHDEYRLVIANGDNAPLDITGLQAQGHVYRALILAAPGTDYHLCYGAEKLAAPRYDTAAIEAARAQGFLPAAATLGGQMPNPAYGGARRFGLADWLDSPFFLAAAIALMVAVLGLLVFRASRHIERLDNDAPDPAEPPGAENAASARHDRR